MSDSPKMHGPATYRIRVRGRLGADWSDRVGGMEINEEEGSEETHTVLVGRLTDQSSLSGVLNTLHDLQLPIISAECIGNDEKEEDSEPEQRKERER